MWIIGQHVTNYRRVALRSILKNYYRLFAAWFFATAFAKQWDATLPYIEQHRLEKDTHNKTIQKAIESFRITDEQKALLKTLRVK